MLAAFLNQRLLWYLPKSNFLFVLSRNLRCLKNCKDPGPLPAAKMELFVTIVHGSKPFIKVLSRGVLSYVISGPRPAFDYNRIS